MCAELLRNCFWQYGQTALEKSLHNGVFLLRYQLKCKHSKSFVYFVSISITNVVVRLSQGCGRTAFARSVYFFKQKAPLQFLLFIFTGDKLFCMMENVLCSVLLIPEFPQNIKIFDIVFQAVEGVTTTGTKIGIYRKRECRQKFILSEKDPSAEQN